MDTLKDRVWKRLFTEGNPQQIQYVQSQIQQFRSTESPLFNVRVLQFQLRIALLMNIYLAYTFIFIHENFLAYLEQSWVNALWLTVMCFENFVIVIPKIAMMIMLEKVVNSARNVNELILKVEKFMQTKVYYYNCFISKYIWLTYAAGGILYFFNYFYSNELAAELITFCDRIMYLMIARIVLFFVKLQFDSKSLQHQNLEKLRTANEYPLSLEEAQQIADSCPVCLENLKEGDNVLRLDCKHVYHSQCIAPWILKCNKCPSCNSFAFKSLS